LGIGEQRYIIGRTKFHLSNGLSSIIKEFTRLEAGFITCLKGFPVMSWR